MNLPTLQACLDCRQKIIKYDANQELCYIEIGLNCQFQLLQSGKPYVNLSGSFASERLILKLEMTCEWLANAIWNPSETVPSYFDATVKTGFSSSNLRRPRQDVFEKYQMATKHITNLILRNLTIDNNLCHFHNPPCLLWPFNLLLNTLTLWNPPSERKTVHHILHHI